jgi:hypothetical protein
MFVWWAERIIYLKASSNHQFGECGGSTCYMPAVHTYCNGDKNAESRKKAADENIFVG